MSWVDVADHVQGNVGTSDALYTAVSSTFAGFYGVAVRYMFM